MPRSLRSALVPAALVLAFCAELATGFASEAQRFGAAPPRSSPAAPKQARFARTFEAARFQRGNLHTHTTLSDGNTSPEQTILWYAAHGYQFLAITDHDRLSRPSRYAALQEPGFVLIPGEEITMTGGGRQVHINALCTKSRIPGGAFPSTSTALSSGIRNVLLQGGVALVNHPNFDWGLSPSDVLDAREAPLLEIASGHPYVHSAGDATHPSHEALWDRALTAGADYMAVAVDDVHRIDVSGNPLALPGKGWVEVFADHADQKAICAGLASGNLYASTGVELRRIAVSPSAYAIEAATSDATAVFIGRDGRELDRIHLDAKHRTATYSPTGDEGYVRARVDGPGAARAWTPAVRVVSE